MDLDTSPEPLRRIAVYATAVLTLVGTVLTALVGAVDVAWLGPTAVAVMAAVAVVSQWAGTETGRAKVWPDVHVTEVVRNLDAEIGDIPAVHLDAVSPTDEAAAGVDIDLDEAARSAGLD